jgi:hypothetical protein
MSAALPTLRLAPAPAGGLTEQIRELLTHLASLHVALSTLAGLAGEKLGALRRADAPALQDCARREGELLNAVFRAEQQRKAVLARVAQSLHLPAEPRSTLTEIAARLGEPLASAVRARSTALQDAAAELQRKNGLVARVAQSLQSHVRGIFAEVAGAAHEPAGYGPRGQHETGTPRCWVDAVG